MSIIIAEVFESELKKILNYWSTNLPDSQYGGFYGKIDSNDVLYENAEKGAVLNFRILWTFSAAYKFTGNNLYLELANRSFDYNAANFIDKEFGGVYWSLESSGIPSDTKKQIYAQAFAIYGLTEFYIVSRNNEALDLAKQLFSDIEKYSFDTNEGGYFEAFSREWNEIADLRLSDKDANEKKTMNTHLHILEAYTNLYRVWPDKILKEKITHLIDVFRHRILNTSTQSLNLFFNEHWENKMDVISYGHDIEASWLLLEAAEVLEESNLIADVSELSVHMARASLKGLNPEGAMNYEYDITANHIITEKHWWVQAEAMVGYLNAWKISGEPEFYNAFESVWIFTNRFIIDHAHGEWHWGVLENGQKMQDQDKAGFWKCPYHNARACMEIIKRLK